MDIEHQPFVDHVPIRKGNFQYPAVENAVRSGFSRSLLYSRSQGAWQTAKCLTVPHQLVNRTILFFFEFECWVLDWTILIIINGSNLIIFLLMF